MLKRRRNRDHDLIELIQLKDELQRILLLKKNSLDKKKRRRNSRRRKRTKQKKEDDKAEEGIGQSRRTLKRK